jgi:hypothetical protein
MSLTHYPISGVAATDEGLTSRAGLASFGLYLKTSGILARLERDFPCLKDSSKGTSVHDFFASVMCWLADGSSRHISSFDELKVDDSFRIISGTKETPSSHVVKRFFKKFMPANEWRFRDLELELFIARLRQEKPTVVVLGLDSMVLDNDDANAREGVEVTYKKLCGFHPVQLTWNGMIVDAQFRSGSRHCHESKFTQQILMRAVQAIRKNYSATVPIIVRLDAGYFDQELFQFMNNELRIGFLCGGRIMESLRDFAADLPQSSWGEYRNGMKVWRYTELGYRCASWDKFWRAVYTQVESREDGQRFLDFARPDSLIITNLGMQADLFSKEGSAAIQSWLSAEQLVEAYHGRGAEELVNRGLKDFGFEQLPFKRYHSNMALYHIMVVAHALFEAFKQNVLPTSVVGQGAYASSVRRRIFDIAGKLVHHSGRIILKIRDCAMAHLQFEKIWQNAAEAEPLLV